MTGKEFYQKLITNEIRLEIGDGIGIENKRGFFSKRTSKIQDWLGVRFWTVTHWIGSLGGIELVESHITGTRRVTWVEYNSDQFEVKVICEIEGASDYDKSKACFKMMSYVNRPYDFLGIVGLLIQSSLYLRKKLRWLVEWINEKFLFTFCSENWLEGYLSRGYYFGKPWEFFPGEIPTLKGIRIKREF